MNGFLYFFYSLRKSLPLPVHGNFHLYNGDVSTYVPTCLIAAVRVTLNRACKMTRRTVQTKKIKAIIMIFKNREKHLAVYLVKIQGDNKCDRTIKRIKHHIGVRWGDLGKKQREGCCPCNSDKKYGIMGGVVLREEGIKRVIFSIFTPFVQKGIDCLYPKTLDGRSKCRGYDFGLVLHLSRSWEAAEAPAPISARTFAKLKSNGKHSPAYRLGSIEFFYVVKKQRRATHQKFGGSLQQSCQTVELVTVRHLLVGLYIAQFPVFLNSNSFVPV